MPKRLSGVDEVQLGYFLERVREIAAVGEEAAPIEMDKFLWEILKAEEDDEEEEESIDEVTTSYPGDAEIQRQNAREFLQPFRRKVKEKSVHSYDVRFFRDSLKGRVYRDGRGTDDPELGRLMAEGLALAAQAVRVSLERELDECLTRTFSNVMSVGNMLDSLDRELRLFLEDNDLTQDLAASIRKIKERGARFRWNKKRSAADVAEKVGSVGKAAGLRREADAVLVQDWEMVFPGEVPPP